VAQDWNGAVMANYSAVTDEDLARAREDVAFRHKMLAENLDQLLAALNRMRRSPAAAKEPAKARQIKEGVELAVKLSDLIHRLVENQPASSQK
jgi:hypothetical protein